MSRIRAFGAFWYDFVIGDDWHVAALVAAGLALTAVLVHAVGVNAWWLLPVFVFAALAWSLHRAAKLSRTFPAVSSARLACRGVADPASGQGTAQIQVNNVDRPALTVTGTLRVLPHVGEDTSYEPPASRKVAIPAAFVAADWLVPSPATLTSAFDNGELGVPPPGSMGPPTCRTLTVSVPAGPPPPAQPAHAIATASAPAPRASCGVTALTWCTPALP